MYLCEYRMMINKNMHRSRSRQTNEHLESALNVASAQDISPHNDVLTLHKRARSLVRAANRQASYL